MSATDVSRWNRQPHPPVLVHSGRVGEREFELYRTDGQWRYIRRDCVTGREHEADKLSITFPRGDLLRYAPGQDPKSRSRIVCPDLIAELTAAVREMLAARFPGVDPRLYNVVHSHRNSYHVVPTEELTAELHDGLFLPAVLVRDFEHGGAAVRFQCDEIGGITIGEM